MTHLDAQVLMHLFLKCLLSLPALLTCADITCRNVIIKQYHITVTECWVCLKCYYELTH